MNSIRAWHKHHFIQSRNGASFMHTGIINHLSCRRPLDVMIMGERSCICSRNLPAKNSTNNNTVKNEDWCNFHGCSSGSGRSFLLRQARASTGTWVICQCHWLWLLLLLLLELVLLSSSCCSSSVDAATAVC
jgi:hypothetical protein